VTETILIFWGLFAKEAYSYSSYDSCLEQATEDLQKLIGKSDPEICPKVKLVKLQTYILLFSYYKTYGR